MGPMKTGRPPGGVSGIAIGMQAAPYRRPETLTLAEQDEVVDEVDDLLARLVYDGGDREPCGDDAPQQLQQAQRGRAVDACAGKSVRGGLIAIAMGLAAKPSVLSTQL